MENAAGPVFLFPHTTLPETLFRQSFFMLPPLRLLEVLKPAVVPGWGQARFHTWPVFADESWRQPVRSLLEQYRGIASVYGDEGILTFVQGRLQGDDLSETRFRIQSELRGRAATADDPARELALEAAVFLELARELDEKELELMQNLSQVGRLEEAFREILGATDEEEAELQHAVQTENPPLAPDWGHFSHEMRRRVGMAFRLLSLRPPEKAPVFVAIHQDVVTELMDPFQTERERSGEAWEPLVYELCTFPSLEGLDAATFTDMMEAMEDSGILSAYFDAFQPVFDNPQHEGRRRSLVLAGEALQQRAEAFLEDRGIQTAHSVKLIGTFPDRLTLSDVWKRFDKKGWETLGKSQALWEAVPALLHLEIGG